MSRDWLKCLKITGRTCWKRSHPIHDASIRSSRFSFRMRVLRLSIRDDGKYVLYILREKSIYSGGGDGGPCGVGSHSWLHQIEPEMKKQTACGRPSNCLTTGKHAGRKEFPVGQYFSSQPGVRSTPIKAFKFVLISPYVQNGVYIRRLVDKRSRCGKVCW